MWRSESTTWSVQWHDERYGDAIGGTGQADALQEIQAPVRDRLDNVAGEMHANMTAVLPLIQEVTTHLLAARGKLVSPTLALLSSPVESRADPPALALAALIVLLHIGKLFLDDSVDHSVLRRGLPTVNARFSHEVSVIMGDLLYSRALHAMAKIGDIEIIRIMTHVSNELAMGRCTSLAAIDRLGFKEEDYLITHSGKDGVAHRRRVRERGALRSDPPPRGARPVWGAPRDGIPDRGRHS